MPVVAAAYTKLPNISGAVPGSELGWRKCVERWPRHSQRPYNVLLGEYVQLEFHE